MGPALLAAAVLGLLIAGVLTSIMLRREAMGMRLTALHVVVLILVLDTSLFPAGGTSTGIFVLPVNNRTTGVLFLILPFLLFIRWLAGGVRPRVTIVGGAWALYFVWMIAELVAGKAHGNSSAAGIQESKAIIMIGGAALLAAGVEARDLIGREGIPRMVRWAAPIACILTATSLAKVSSNSSFGLFTGVNTGALGADAASVFASLGMLGLVVGLAAPKGHRRGLIASFVLLIAPIFTGQRASLLGVVAGCLLIAVWPLFSKAHRVMHVLPRERVRLGLILLALAGLLAGASAVGHGYDPKKSQVAASFSSPGKADSAQSRRNQWKVSSELIGERPWLGWGLGKEYTHIEKIEGAPEFVAHNDLTHDIFLDVLLRTGIVGLLLLLFALGSTAVAGLRAAYVRVSPRIGALGLASTAILLEMITRGAVESIFEKERLAVLLGLTVGIACSARRTTRTGDRASSLEAAPLVVPPEWLASGSTALVSTALVPRQNT